VWGEKRREEERGREREKEREESRDKEKAERVAERQKRFRSERQREEIERDLERDLERDIYREMFFELISGYAGLDQGKCFGGLLTHGCCRYALKLVLSLLKIASFAHDHTQQEVEEALKLSQAKCSG